MKRRIVSSLVAAMAMGVMAETVNTVTVTKFHQSYPYSGKATVEYTVGGTLPPNAVAEIVIKTGGASATFVQRNIVTGANTNVIDFASSFGGALVLNNASFTVTIHPGGVQLWENGPYWAECNVGASAPEESGYYFWWGDTVGYVRSGGTWTDDEWSDGYYYDGVTWVSGTGQQMISSPFDYSTCPTMNKDNSTLQSEGWIDSAGNLVAAHDAATAHLGAPWRMPTDADFSALISNCTTTWTTRNGVNGYEVRGRDDYAANSIFLPAAGYGYDSYLYDPGSYGSYWFSTPNSGRSDYAWHLGFDSGYFGRSDYGYRYGGKSVRPVRGFAAGCSASGIVTYDPELTVNVTKFHQSYPYSGRATVEYTVGGTLPANAVAEFTITTDDTSARFVQSNIVAGANTNVIDFASSFGGALVLTNASFTVTIRGFAGCSASGRVTYDLEPPVNVTKFHQSYPYTGRATVEYTVGGALSSCAVAEFTINTDDASATFVQSNVVAGANSHVIDFASSFGGALLLTNASFTVTITGNFGGVQLWENGPYWAECNVGASAPEESGYYFWWGDTVGYVRSGGTWTDDEWSDGYYYDGVTWVSGTGQQMVSSPFDYSTCPTMNKDNSTLQSEGWIDATGNLVAAHDAATAHLGAPWRMPTDADFSALISNCTTTWTTRNGVNGYEVRGRDDYAANSIFLPAAGYGYDSYLYDPGSYGSYWFSTPNSGRSDYAWHLGFDSGYFGRSDYGYRYGGKSVRPVLGFAAGRSASGVVTYDVPIVIESVADWDALSAAVAGGLETEGAFVLLANDVGPVTTTVGTAEHPFAGVFDGGSNTLTVALSGAGECVAPFSRIDGATIRDLVVTGTVAGGIHSAGLVGICGATGPNVIRDCTVAVTVNGSGYAGGIVGHGGSGTLTLDGCVFGGSVNGFNTCAAGLMGWCDALTLTITNCLSKGTFTPSGDGKYHPVACRFANRDVSATVAGAYYLNTILPTVPGVNPALARTNLIPGAEGTPVSATLVAGEWAEPVAAPDGNTYYAWTPAPAGRLLAHYTFDDAGNAGTNLLRAAVGRDAVVRATPATPVAGIGAIAAVTDASLLECLAAGDGAVSIPQGQYLAIPIPAALLAAPGRPYTVAMRIRVPGDAGWRCLLNMPASNDSDALVYVHRSDRKLGIKQFDKSSGGGTYSDYTLETDIWMSLVVAFGENTTDAYFDGAPILHAEGALAGSYADCVASGGYILVGADDGADDALFYLSDVRIYEGAVASADHFFPGSGTRADPYLISSAADWNELCALVADGSIETEGRVVRLVNDVGPVATMVGTAEHPFAGIFEGDESTLTVALSGTGECVAPFSRVSGATIRDLRVAGTVAGGMHCSGLVGAVHGGAANLVEGCEVAAAISCSRTHFGGFVGHSSANAVTLRGCVFSGSLSGGTCVATFNGWSDDGAATTLIDCLDASASTHPIGRGEGAVCVSNTYYLASKDFSNEWRLWSEGNRGGRAYCVMGGEDVYLDFFSEPLRDYGGSGLAVHSDGLARGGTLYAEAGASILLGPLFTGTPPAGMKHDAFQASAGTLSRSGDAWVLTMPAGDVSITATFAEATAYELWAAANGVAGAWDATDASGIANVFRYVFNVPTGAFTNPPLLDIAIEDGNAVVITPPVSNTVGFTVSVVESSDVAGAAVTRRKPLDATGRTVFPMGNAASRFYRLSATEGDVSLGGVQLWENGPYWAECNVGASEPEDFGYYFWWGDTVGYTRSGGTLGLFGLYTSVTWVSSTGEQMSSSPFSPSSCPTYGKDDSELLSAGYVDSTGNLAPEYDAATAHLGAPWRMPTDAEFAALTNNCIATWITTNGVSGRLVTGTGAYADRSIFLPAPGYGSGSNFGNPNSHGYYWSSTPDSGDSHYAWYLDFNSSLFQRYIYYGRQYGLSVRPVRDAD